VSVALRSTFLGALTSGRTFDTGGFFLTVVMFLVAASLFGFLAVADCAGTETAIIEAVNNKNNWFMMLKRQWRDYSGKYGR